MENNQIASTIQKLEISSLYGYKSSYPKYNAQQNLDGRTHWASDDNLRFFGCRISSARETESGLLFYVIESSFLDFNKTKRGFRYAIFDIFGECVARLDIDHAFKTSEQARKAMWKELETFNTAEHYKQALDRIAKRADREANRAREALANLTEEALA